MKKTLQKNKSPRAAIVLESFFQYNMMYIPGKTKGAAHEEKIT